MVQGAENLYDFTHRIQIPAHQEFIPHLVEEPGHNAVAVGPIFQHQGFPGIAGTVSRCLARFRRPAFKAGILVSYRNIVNGVKILRSSSVLVTSAARFLQRS